VDDAQALARKHYAALNARDFVAYGEHLDDHVTVVSDAGVTVGREASVAMAQNLVRLFPSLHIEVERMTVAPGSVICELRFEGVFEVDEHGVERPAESPGMLSQIIDAREGRIVALRTYRSPDAADPSPVGRIRSHGHDRGLTNERAALRHVAVLAAGSAPLEDVLAAAVLEASALLGGTTTTLLRYDERPTTVVVVACTDSSQLGRRLPIEQDAVGVPITLESGPWGILTATATDQPLPAGTALSLSEIARVIAAAIASAEARDELRRLVDEQSALRRVAELVAHGAGEDELFNAVAAEAARLIGDESANLVRFVGPRTYIIVATSGGPAPVGLQIEIPEDHDGTDAEVLRTHRAARRDDYQIRSGPLFDRHDFRKGSSVSVPILVGGRLWGMLGTLTEDRPLPAGTEARLEKFAALIAAAMANSEARAEVQLLADEQTALRRIAELVAHGAAEAELFEAVAIEASGLVGNEATTLVRYEGDRAFTILSTSGGPARPGTLVVVPPDDRGALDQLIRDPRRSVRLDDYGTASGPVFTRERFGVRSSVSVPILVEDQLWGALGALTDGRRLPVETEDRLQKFTELVAAALANNHARAELRRLADEQTGLRRVAELVARGAPPEQVFDVVALEAGRLANGEAMTLVRFESDRELVVMASSGGPAAVGRRIVFLEDTLPDRILRGGRTSRVDDYTAERDAALAVEYDLVAAVAAAISVEGRVWGMLTATSPERPVAAGTEQRLSQFADLVGAAIANAENKASLTASRARVVATADETRLRIQRDVHDGAQQRLVQTSITLQRARDVIAQGDSAAGLIDEALFHADRANSDLRDLVQGIMPASLSRGGLASGLESLLADLPIPVDLEIVAPRFEAATETTAYFIVAEALTNVVKHAKATRADVRVTCENDAVIILVSDDGVGGADPTLGTGLTGLSDRVAVAEGSLAITSRAGEGTMLRAELPLIQSPATK
jgi:signal transduction histidine kinase